MLEPKTSFILCSTVSLIKSLAGFKYFLGSNTFGSSLKIEINKLIGLTKQKGYSLVPISLYFKGSFVKLELGIGKGKKLYDKRQDIAKREAQRRIQQAMNN